MKLHKSLLMFGASALLLAACGDEGSTADEGTVEEPEVTDVAEEDTADEVTEQEVVEVDSNAITLGEPIEFDGFTMTITGYGLSTDMDDNDALVIHYDWENTSDETVSPFMTFVLKGFQNGVETSDEIFMVDGVDLAIGQNEVRPGGKIEGATDQVGIDDLNAPLELELDELFSFESNARLVELDLSTLQ